MEQYTEKVMDHFQNPRNVGEIKDADGVGEVGNLRCGDVMKIYIKVGKRYKKQDIITSKIPNSKSSVSAGASPDGQISNNIQNHKSENSKLTTDNLQPTTESEEYIEDIKFKTLGCAAAIASSSMTTEIARGKGLKEAENISKDDINEALGKLPAPKYHCSILAAEGIKRAITDYHRKKQ